jgi:hypothetical protein
MNNNSSSSSIPEGFVEVIGPNGQLYLVPRFYAPALNTTTALDGLEEKKKLEIEKAAGTVSFFIYLNWPNDIIWPDNIVLAR